MRRVTATFIVEVEGDLMERSDDELKEFAFSLLEMGGMKVLNWEIEEITE